MSVLEAIHGTGEQMLAALEAGELERFFDLVTERGTLLERLKEDAHPAGSDPDAPRLAAALAEQFALLTEAVAAQERRLGEALASFERYKSARNQYRQPPRAGGILNQHLSV